MRQDCWSTSVGEMAALRGAHARGGNGNGGDGGNRRRASQEERRNGGRFSPQLPQREITTRRIGRQGVSGRSSHLAGDGFPPEMWTRRSLQSGCRHVQNFCCHEGVGAQKDRTPVSQNHSPRTWPRLTAGRACLKPSVVSSASRACRALGAAVGPRFTVPCKHAAVGMWAARGVCERSKARWAPVCGVHGAGISTADPGTHRRPSLLSVGFRRRR